MFFYHKDLKEIEDGMVQGFSLGPTIMQSSDCFVTGVLLKV